MGITLSDLYEWYHFFSLKILVILIGVVVLSALSTSLSFADDGDLKFHGKGTISGKDFNGGRIWTTIDGDKSTIIAQWSLGRAKINADLSQTSDCDPVYKICLVATVSNVYNSSTVQVGDQFIIKIDPDNKKEIIVGKSGSLANVEIIVDITQTYKIKAYSDSVSPDVLNHGTLNTTINWSDGQISDSEYASTMQSIINSADVPSVPTNTASASAPLSDAGRAQSFVVRFSNGLINEPLTITTFYKFQITSSVKDDTRGSLQAYQFTDKPEFYLESLPSKDKKIFYKGVENWMTRSTTLRQFDVDITVMSGDNKVIQTWKFGQCQMLGYGVFLQDVTNFYPFSNNVGKSEIRERANFGCAGVHLQTPQN